MWVVSFVKSQRKVARKDYRGAVQVLECELIGTNDDLTYLVMIAQYQLWDGNEEKAIEAAKKALRIDPNNFEMSKMLSVVYAKHEKHEEAVKLVKIAIQNYKPESCPTPPLWLHSALRAVSRFSTRLNNIEEAVRDPNKGKRDWRAWADAYLSWYNETMTK